MRKLDKLGVGDGGKSSLGFLEGLVGQLQKLDKTPSTSPRYEGICDDGDMW